MAIRAVGFASAGVDFGQTTGILDFPVGQTRGVIAVTILGDNAWEGTERLTLKLFDPSGLDLNAASDVRVLYGDIDDDDSDGRSVKHDS
jgi:hypothetical protein